MDMRRFAKFCLIVAALMVVAIIVLTVGKEIFINHAVEKMESSWFGVLGYILSGEAVRDNDVIEWTVSMIRWLIGAAIMAFLVGCAAYLAAPKPNRLRG